MKHKTKDMVLEPVDPAGILPPEFDVNLIDAFFRNAERDPSGRSDDAFRAPIEKLEMAGDLASTDLQAHARPLRDMDEAETLDVGETRDSAFAKPAHAGGNGKGGKKEKTDPAPDPEKSVDETTSEPEPEPIAISEPIAVSEPAPLPENGNYVSGLDTPYGFNIEVEFIGGWTDAYKQSLINVVEAISDIVVGDLPSYGGHDDFHLKAVINAIDGEGGYLGVGGTLVQRPDSHLPSEGYFRFDEADVGNSYGKGNFEDVILHETLHAMGFGTAWDDLGLVAEIGGQTRFTGEAATALYNTEFAAIAENDAGSHYGVPLAADDAHWNHNKFTKEMMTTSLYSSGNYLSDMSVAALQDMGYETVLADQFLIA